MCIYYVQYPNLLLTRLSGVEDLEGLATVRRACTETVDFLEIAALSADIFDKEIWGLIVSIGIRSLPHQACGDRTVFHPFVAKRLCVNTRPAKRLCVIYNLYTLIVSLRNMQVSKFNSLTHT